MSEKSTLEKFLLDEAIDVNVRSDRFEMAWDINEIFGDLKIDMHKRAFDTLRERMGNAFEGYQRFDSYYPDELCEIFTFFKPEWALDEKGCILSYTFQRTRLVYDSFGIAKYRNLDGIPYKGSWRDANLPKPLSEILENLYKAVQGLDVIWGMNRTLKQFVVEPWVELPGLGDEDWILKFSTPLFYEPDIYLMILDRGYEAVIDDYLEYVRTFRLCTEPYVDAFVKAFREAYPNP